ncbi:MAG: TonB-dependent hemoglobin/transferrin/lactoferrin family receptor [Rhodoferax sp.]
MKTRRRAWGVLATLVATHVVAQESNPVAPTKTLPAVVVTATRTESALDETAANVTAVNRQQLQGRMPRDEADLFLDEVDVSFARDLRRHGATRVNIRGIEDNRVLSLVDGVRMGDYYNGGGPTNFTQSSVPGVMPEFLKRVEVVRGPASSLYGSDALGGVVGYVTIDPQDFLGERSLAGEAGLGYHSANGSISQSVVGALRTEGAEWLLGYSHAAGRETGNMGTVDTVASTRTRPNWLKTEDQGVLAKGVLHPAAGHTLRLALEAREQGVDSDILRLPASLARVSSMVGDDNAHRVRASVEWEHVPQQAHWYERLLARAYHQVGRTRNYNTQVRSSTTAGCSAVTAGTSQCYIEQDFAMDQSTLGFNLQMMQGLRAAGLQHQLSYGLDVANTRVQELRDARIWNRTTGTFTKSLAGETYPLRDFANGRTETEGLFVQDELAGLAGGRLTLTPGLRFDHSRLSPEMDALAQQTLTSIGRSASGQEHAAISPKIGAVWRLQGPLALFGQLAKGFRAPNYSEVNAVFRNTAQSYGVAPNPDLKAETSVGAEMGLRYERQDLRAQFSVFDNHYSDFIEQVRYDCTVTPANAACISGLSRTLQSVNLQRVRIYGAEARGQWAFAPGWNATGALAWVHGSNEQTGAGLDSVDPMRLSASLERVGDGWSAQTRLRAAADKDRTDDSGTGGVWYRPGGYAVLDLSGRYQLARQVWLTAALNNVFDKKYWLWSDIRAADANNPVGVDFYSQSGRSLALALQATF